MVTIYNSGGFYGEGLFYGGAASPSNGIPQDLRFYRTSQDGVYVFYWTFLPAFITPSLSTADFQLELDTTPIFTSPNLVSFTSSTAISYQNGNVWKGFSVPVAARINDTVQTWYARVRTVSGAFTSDWSATLVWTIPQSWQQQVAEDLMTTLQDAHVYGKGDLLKPVDERNTNLWVVENMYGNQFDKAYYENFLTQTDNFISLVRDEFLYQNFGILFNFPKSNLQQFIEYRETLRQLILGSLNGSTVSPIYAVVQTFTGVPPVIQNIRDLNDFFLNYIEETPLDAPNGTRTEFRVTYEFVPGSVQIFKNDTRLTPGVDFTEDEALPGFIMTIAPGAMDVLIATYKIGAVNDPTPVLFDPTDTVVLTGNITYTKDSVNVTGSGTLFSIEVSNGDILVDGNGYYSTVASVNSNTSITLLNPWEGSTETVAGLKAIYDIPPLVLWDKFTLAFGIIISIPNPGGFILDLDLIESLVNPLLPAYAKVFYQIVS